MNPTNPSGYQFPHIQGLRAVAVGMVLLYHFQLMSVSGGFAGVDIFFVISGYLMTSILVRSSQQPKWPMLIRFYGKRLRRIAPAYFFVLLFVFVSGWLFYLPLDLVRIGNSVAAAAVFASNHFFQYEAGYFDVSSTFKPLLHTWSLAVEVQFYLIWPIAFLLVGRFSERTQAAILLVTILASFSLSVHLSNLDPGVAFYSLPTRIWEFSFGALAANSWVTDRLKGIVSTKLVLVFAMVMIVSAFELDQSMLWPGPWALIPVVATSVILLYGIHNHRSPVIRVLSYGPMVWLGNLSYSLYLVHWPLVSIIFVVWWPDPSLVIRLATLVVSIGLAWVLHRFVENPIRFGLSKNSHHRTATLGLVAMCGSLVVAGTLLGRSDGLIDRFPKELHRPLQDRFELAKIPRQAQTCQLQPTECPAVDGIKNSVLLWGDSHADQFAESISIFAQQAGQDIKIVSVGGCPPLRNATRSRGYLGAKTKCLEANQGAFETALHADHIQTVILAARWAFHVETTRFGSEKGSPTFVVRSNSNVLSQSESQKILAEELDAAIGALKQANKRVVVIMQVPELEMDGRRCFQFALLNRIDAGRCNVGRKLVDDRQLGYRALLSDLAVKWDNLSIIDLNDQICDAHSCSAMLDGKLAYADNNHLLPGATWELLLPHRSLLFSTPLLERGK